ncbi:MAG: glycosyltransferase [Candidatus Omnitrophica bacterium]|nr:glycosyltransferase [Candidatus Omnitrophota bacterium]
MKIQKNTHPLISVIMPVYNAGDFLVEAIESILHQTYKNFEFIIVDDASIDNSWQILKVFKKKDKRIKIYKFKKNVGVSQTVKFAIEKTKGKFLARMDADDVAHPQRLEKQLNYLLKNPQTVAVGSQCYLINKKGKILGRKTFPTKFEDVYKYIFTFIPIQQPTLMINKTKLPKDFEYYYDGMNTAEEVELLFKLFRYGKVENLEEILHYYRLHEKNTSLQNLKKTFLLTLISRIKAIFKYGYKPTIFGIISTFIQTLLVIFLPSKLILKIYWTLKNNKLKKLSFFSFQSRLKKIYMLSIIKE